LCRAQTEICQGIFGAIQERGNTVQRETEQLYSLPISKFLADRFVGGTCPKCRYEDARGDQCDGCGTLLNPTELLNPKCMLTGTKPVLRSTRHVYIDLPKLSGELAKYVETTSAQVRCHLTWLYC
jgi:methionyl-tRNA synthetase